jgi:hypothetical protein
VTSIIFRQQNRRGTVSFRDEPEFRSENRRLVYQAFLVPISNVENVGTSRRIMNIRTIILAIVAGVLGCQACLAQSISQSDLYNFVRTTWNVSSLSDSAIQQLLNQAPSDVTYDGIPYENLIGAVIESPRIVDDINAGDYRAAGQVVLNYAQDQLFDVAMEDLGRR